MGDVRIWEKTVTTINLIHVSDNYGATGRSQLLCDVINGQTSKSLRGLLGSL